MQHVNNLQQLLDHSNWQTYDEKFFREFPRNTSKRAAVGRFETCQIKVCSCTTCQESAVSKRSTRVLERN